MSIIDFNKYALDQHIMSGLPPGGGQSIDLLAERSLNTHRGVNMDHNSSNTQDAPGLPSEGGKSNTSVLKLDLSINLIKFCGGQLTESMRETLLQINPDWENKNIDWMIYILIQDGTFPKSVMEPSLYRQLSLEEQGEEDVTDLSALHMACLRVWDSEIYEYEERPSHIRELIKFIDPKYKITFGKVMRYCGYECSEE